MKPTIRVTLSVLATVVTLAGCSTHQVALRYHAPGIVDAPEEPIPLMAVGQFQDQRGKADPFWLGSIRGGVGTMVQTLVSQTQV